MSEDNMDMKEHNQHAVIPSDEHAAGDGTAGQLLKNQAESQQRQDYPLIQIFSH